MTRVSVIIPAYNAETTLAATVGSVLAQSHGDMEVLVVDDGSADGTLSVAHDLAQADGRLRVIAKQNGGVASARNAALEVAEGDLCAWIDSDDLWHPTKIEKQLEVHRCHPEAGLIYTGYRLIDERNIILPNFRRLSDLSGDTVCTQIATNFFTNVSSIMVPTRIARSIGGHDPTLRRNGYEGAEDFLFQLRVALRHPLACCREALVGYRMHSENMSLDHERASRSNLAVLDMIAADHPYLPARALRLGRARVVGYAAHLLQQGRVAAAARLAFRCFSRQPAETLAFLGLILRESMTPGRSGGTQDDPETGREFLKADPTTAPWGRPLLLTKRMEQALAEEDARVARRMHRPSPDTFTCSPGLGNG